MQLHQLPLGEPIPEPEVIQILQSSRDTPLFRAVLQTLRDRSSGSTADAMSLAHTEQPGVSYQLGAAAALSELALALHSAAFGSEEDPDGDPGE